MWDNSHFTPYAPDAACRTDNQPLAACDARRSVLMAPQPDVAPDVAIVGGGIVGLTTACQLIRAGASVCLLDAAPAVREASWAGAGLLLPLKPWSTPDTTRQLIAGAGDAYRQLAQQLRDETGEDPGFGEQGVFFARQDDADFCRWTASQQQQGQGQWLDRAELRQIFGEYTPAGDEMFWLRTGNTLHPARFCRALSRWLSDQSRFSLHSPQSVISVQMDGARVAALQTNRGMCRARHYVVAAGAWTGQLLPQLAGRIRPARGQILAWSAAGALPATAILGSDYYAVLRPHGLILVGSTVEKVGYDRLPTRAGYEQLLRQAAELIPQLGQTPPRFLWSGLRPAARRPLIGRIADCENLWVNSGHFREGIVTAPASARLCADLLLGRPPHLDPSCYDPNTCPPDLAD